MSGEPDTGRIAQPLVAPGNLRGIGVHAARLGKRAVNHGDEGSVAAAVIEEAPAGVGRRECARHVEPAAMAPGDDAAAGEDLLAGIVPTGKAIRLWGVGVISRETTAAIRRTARASAAPVRTAGAS